MHLKRRERERERGHALDHSDGPAGAISFYDPINNSGKGGLYDNTDHNNVAAPFVDNRIRTLSRLLRQDMDRPARKSSEGKEGKEGKVNRVCALVLRALRRVDPLLEVRRIHA